MIDRTHDMVEALRLFKENRRAAFFATDSHLYGHLRNGYLDRNLNLTPAAYRLLHTHPEGMRNEA